MSRHYVFVTQNSARLLKKKIFTKNSHTFFVNLFNFMAYISVWISVVTLGLVPAPAPLYGLQILSKSGDSERM